MHSASLPAALSRPSPVSRLSRLFVAALVLSAGLLLAAPSPAPAVDMGVRVTNSFYDTDLRQALTDLSLDAGISIIAGPDVSGFVTCELLDVPLQQALDMLLAGTGFLVVDRGQFLLVTSGDPESPSFLELSESELVKVNYATSEDIYNMLPPPMRKYVHLNATQNTLSVLAPPQLVARITREIRKLDQPQKHVQLDAMIVAMQQQDLLNLGIQWGFPSVSVGAFTNDAVARYGFVDGESVNLNMFGLQWPWGAQIGYTPGREFTAALTMQLNMLAQNEDATIIASPQVVAQDGKEARIEVITEEYFEILTQGIYTNSKLEKIDSGTILSIKPLVSDTGEITLEIGTEVSDVVSRRSTNELPTVTRRKANTTVRIKDGGTVAIAGLLDNRSLIKDEKVPGFGDVPIAGGLFKNNGGIQSQKQVAVFITARLLDAPGDQAEQKPIPRPALSPISEEAFRPLLQDALNRVKREFRSRPNG